MIGEVTMGATGDGSPPGYSLPPMIFGAMLAVAGDLAKLGIAKTSTNVQQHYAFRGIDAVMNTLAPLLAKYGVLVLPTFTNRVSIERQSKSGGAVFFVTVAGEFTFVARDGSHVAVATIGEAQDSADKATNKAMTAAYKYAMFQAFCIPLEASDDADRESVEVKAAAPSGFEAWVLDMEAVAAEGTTALQAAWKASRVELRKHLTETQPAAWEALKARAAAVAVPA